MSKIITVSTDNEAKTEEITGSLLPSLQKAVDGFIEVVRPTGLVDPYVMVVNDEGMLIGLAINLIGSLLYGTHIHGQPIFGNIAILKEGLVNGEPDLLPLDDYEAEGLLTTVKAFFNH